jgi:SOS response regulatory protein OraA/RecX
MRTQVPGAEFEAAQDRLRAAGFLDDVALLDALVRRRRRALRALAEPVQRRRLYGFLARRGYSADVIARALDAKT